MKINITEINFSLKLTQDNKHPDLLAYASIKFLDEHGRYFSCNGFTIRKSKYDGKPYMAIPSKKTGIGFFKFNLIEKSLLKEIEKEIIDQYERETIPIVEEKPSLL